METLRRLLNNIHETIQLRLKVLLLQRMMGLGLRYRTSQNVDRYLQLLDLYNAKRYFWMRKLK